MPNWKGTISFSLVTIPVQLSPATEDHAVSLHLLHKTDHAPIRFARVCRKDGREVPWKDIVKGYELNESDYVVIDQKELDKATAHRSDSIEILSFANEKEIESYYFEKPYYVEPLKGAEKSYGLFREALFQSQKVAVAKIVFTNKEHLAVLKTERDFIVLNTIRFESEIRYPKTKAPPSYSAHTKELEMALRIINDMTAKFNPKQYKDTYTQELKSYLQKKAKGRPLPGPEKEKKSASPSPDLMEALRASLLRTKPGSPKEKNRAIHPAAGRRS